ncbi:hypothetical protein [Geodermatophilus sabuli]|uniref:hypothetical protein n=1 Tax=Geodermatophilus sabuli TaxID=1564158 RepID=UPI000BE2D3CE|nr:hypothetical protein [Geodermatophilus sabuli]MBB3084225.1 hypothetical protein [Geodermatophilus sabuli]
MTLQLAVLEHGEYAGAIGVYLAGHRAGSIPADQLEAYRPVVAELTAQGHPATCRAAFVGGGAMRDGDGVLNFGLGMLQPNRPEIAGPDAPFLPPHVGMRVSVDEQLAAELDAGSPARRRGSCSAAPACSPRRDAVDRRCRGRTARGCARRRQLLQVAQGAGIPADLLRAAGPRAGAAAGRRSRPSDELSVLTTAGAIP